MITLRLEKISDKAADLIENYLNLTTRVTEGNFWKISIEERKFHYLPGLATMRKHVIIYQKNTDSWQEKDSLRLSEWNEKTEAGLAILLETKSSVVYAYKDGSNLEHLVIYELTNELEESKMLHGIELNDLAEEKAVYAEKGELGLTALRNHREFNYRSGWQHAYFYFDSQGKQISGKEPDPEVVIFFNQHFDRSHDAVADSFQLIFWVKGKGMVKSEEFESRIRHPRNPAYAMYGESGFKNYNVRIDPQIEISDIKRNCLTCKLGSKESASHIGRFSGSVRDCKFSNWKADYEFRLKWE